MNPKAGEDVSGALPQESPEAGSDSTGKAESIRCGVPEALKPGSSRWLARAALVLGGRPGVLPVRTRM